MGDNSKQILAADIGGTSSRFGHFSLSSGSAVLEKATWIETKSVSSFKQLLDVLAAQGFTLAPEAADIVSIAIAGPIENGAFCKPTQVDWDLDLRQAQKDFGIGRFALINDFLAQAYASVSPIGQSAKQILSGTPDPDGAIAVIGAGTGLGKAFLISDLRGGRLAGPSEGGHSTFSAESADEFKFMQFVKETDNLPYVTWEDIISGRGLNRIHRFLTGEDLRPEEVAQKFAESPETAAWSARLYGRAARNFALEVLATGGVFVAGGIAAKNPILVEHPEFERSFRSSRRHERLLSKIPVMLNANQESGLWGAAWLGAYRLGID